MPISLESLCQAIRPKACSLVLGAGSSVPSGGPTGAELARKLWKEIANSEAKSDDLEATASILIRRYSRRAVVETVIATLKPLKPTGGLLGLPKFPWPRIFTTNFDCLIEKSYKANSLPLSVIRSNYDFTYQEANPATRLYKIHGCITQDESLGDKASMILSEQDYENYSAYRQAMFGEFRSALLTGDVLIIGQSLEDRHLSDLVKEVLKSKNEGAPGQVYVLVYNKDDLRAPLLEDRGARIAFGGIDQLIHGLAVDPQQASKDEPISATGVLSPAIVSTVYDVTQERSKPSNVTRMFNGGPASFADIRSGATFERSQTAGTVDALTAGDPLVVTIIGAAGVGKTTFARQLLSIAAEQQLFAWEHRADFQFQASAWLSVEALLRSSGKRGVLLIDECVHYMRAVNGLIDALSKIENPSIAVVLTANSALWAPRVKSPQIYKRGAVIELSRLDNSEIESLINLVQHNTEISSLVHAKFKKTTRAEQRESLRRKCSADMFVCLNNIFQTDGLDTILLQEYNDLDETLQEYYRYVAALEAVGTKVHRQLVIRILNMSPTMVSAVLSGLSGIVDEYEIRPQDGIYGWSTRHLVIARKIADYKFSRLEDLENLFESIISNLNPAERIELQTVRDICDRDFGIGRLGDINIRQRLYRRLIKIAPAERIPWHRLIRELLQAQEFGEVEHTIRNAEEAVGLDAPLSRFKVRLLIARSEHTHGISESDRTALLRKAYEQAMANVELYEWDKFSYAVLCEAAIRLAGRGESIYLVDEAIRIMQAASDRISDPHMDAKLREFVESRNRLNATIRKA